MKPSFFTTQTKTIPAGEERDYPIAGSYFYCDDATREFLVAHDDAEYFDCEAFRGFGMLPGEKFARIRIKNLATVPLIVRFTISSGQVIDRRVNPKVLRSNDDFASAVQDGALGAVTEVLSVAVPPLQPSRTLWMFYEHTTMPVGARAEFVCYFGAVEVLRILARHQIAANQFRGFAATAETLADAPMVSRSMVWNNSDGNPAFRIPPFPLRVVCDRIALEHDAGAGTVRAMLEVQSSES